MIYSIMVTYAGGKTCLHHFKHRSLAVAWANSLMDDPTVERIESDHLRLTKTGKWK